MMYIQRNREKLQRECEENPLKEGNSFGAISRELGRRWKALSSKDRREFEQLAAEDKLRHEREKIEYETKIKQETEKSQEAYKSNLEALQQQYQEYAQMQNQWLQMLGYAPPPTAQTAPGGPPLPSADPLEPTKLEVSDSADPPPSTLPPPIPDETVPPPVASSSFDFNAPQPLPVQQSIKPEQFNTSLTNPYMTEEDVYGMNWQAWMSAAQQHQQAMLAAQQPPQLAPKVGQLTSLEQIAGQQDQKESSDL